jgi:molybdopterin-guanine dinucleotide biosynthesis protein A
LPRNESIVFSAAGFVLAGGESSRMGTDKALALFNGIPLIENALATLAAAGLTGRIAGSRSQLDLYAEAIPDTFPNTGPLGGIHAALSASQAEWNVFVPVDLPLMPASLLTALLERAQRTDSPVTVAALNGKIEPFPVILQKSVLDNLTYRLKSGRSACHAAWQEIPGSMNKTLDAVSVESLLQTGQIPHPASLAPALWFQGANTPAELAQLNGIAAKFAVI